MVVELRMGPRASGRRNWAIKKRGGEEKCRRHTVSGLLWGLSLCQGTRGGLLAGLLVDEILFQLVRDVVIVIIILGSLLLHILLLFHHLHKQVVNVLQGVLVKSMRVFCGHRGRGENHVLGEVKLLEC